MRFTKNNNNNNDSEAKDIDKLVKLSEIWFLLFKVYIVK